MKFGRGFGIDRIAALLGTELCLKRAQAHRRGRLTPWDGEGHVAALCPAAAPERLSGSSADDPERVVDAAVSLS